MLQDRQGNKYYRIDEAAEILNVHPSTVRNWIRAKKIKAIRIATWRIPVEEVDRISEEGINSANV